MSHEAEEPGLEAEGLSGRKSSAASGLLVRVAIMLRDVACASPGGDEGDLPVEQGRLVGGLILRGNKCVLVRSLAGEWEGMRLPWGERDGDESSKEAALHIACDMCDIEETEVNVLDIAPVTLAVPGMPIQLHALYAVSPPPAGDGDNDSEDPEDVYDW